MDTNLTPLCPSHHRLREHGWRLHHDPRRPGHVRWTSRLGHTYHRQPPPDLDSLPDPAPNALRDGDPDPYPHWPHSEADPTHCFHENDPAPPPEPKPETPPAPASADPDDVPPF